MFVSASHRETHKLCSIEYGGKGNKGQVTALVSNILEEAKTILGCLSKTCNEAVIYI